MDAGLKRRPRILLALPLPPPRSGQERLTESFLRCGLAADFELIHVNTSLGETNAERGRVTPRRMWRSALVSARVVYALVRRRPDVLNIPLAKNQWGFLRVAVLILAGRLVGARVVSRLGGDHFNRFYDAAPWPMRLIIRWVLGSLAAVVVRADVLKRQFAGLVEAERIHTVYLGLDAADFQPPADWRRPDDGVLRILFIGHISKAKGAFDLLHAVPDIVEQVPQAAFVLAGDQLSQERDVVHVAPGDDLHAMLEAALDRCGTRRHVTLTVATDQATLAALYWNADVFVLPSYSEGFPFAVLEAMAAELPMVVTPAGALAEVLVPEVDALIVPAGDPTALANAIVRLARDEGLRRRMGASNRRLVRERFGLAQLRERMTAVFAGVIDGARPSRSGIGSTVQQTERQ